MIGKKADETGFSTLTLIIISLIILFILAGFIYSIINEDATNIVTNFFDNLFK